MEAEGVLSFGLKRDEEESLHFFYFLDHFPLSILLSFVFISNLLLGFIF